MKNINKQEELVSALWDFAKGLQYSSSIKNGTCATSRSLKGGEFETKMDMEVMHEALHRIANNFNLEIQPIQQPITNMPSKKVKEEESETCCNECRSGLSNLIVYCEDRKCSCHQNAKSKTKLCKKCKHFLWHATCNCDCHPNNLKC